VDSRSRNPTVPVLQCSWRYHTHTKRISRVNFVSILYSRTMGVPLAGYFTQESSYTVSIHYFTVAVLKRSVMKSLYNSFLWFCMADSLSERQMSLWYHNKNWPLSPGDIPILSPLTRHLSVLIREHTVTARWENMALFCINKHHMLFCTWENTTNVMETIKNATHILGKNSHHTAASFIKELNPFTLQSRPK
jgi:hypothetical protein